MRLTEEQYADLMRKRAVSAPDRRVAVDQGSAGMQTPAEPENAPSGPKFKSKAEARYAQILESRKRAGDIAGWEYEAMSLVIGRGGNMTSRITPDFVVRRHDDRLEVHEVKGWLRDDARAKLLAAVKQWPMFDWFLLWAKKGKFEPERLR